MTIGKTIGEIYTNYTVESMEFAGYLPRTLLGVCTPERL